MANPSPHSYHSSLTNRGLRGTLRKKRLKHHSLPPPDVSHLQVPLLSKRAVVLRRKQRMHRWIMINFISLLSLSCRILFRCGLLLLFVLGCLRFYQHQVEHHEHQRYFFPQASQNFQPLPHDETGLPNVLHGCGTSSRQVDEIQVHVIGWRRHDSLQTLLEQLKYANYEDWNIHIPLYIHLDGGNYHETLAVAQRFEWTHGPKFVNRQPKNIGLRSMWLDSIGSAAHQAGNNTLLLVFEDDMRVSLSYFQWLLAVIDAYGRNPRCRDSNLMGFSLSPIRLEEMKTPFKRWNAREAMGNRYDNDNRHIAYLASLPSSWGAAYWSDRWKEFDTFVRLRMQPPYYNITAEQSIHGFNYDEVRLTPKELHIPNARSNVWPKSWKRFMIDFMFARGLVMLYPNLPGEQALASTLALQGEHVNGTNRRYKNPRVAEILQHLDFPRLGSLPRYGDLAVFDLHLKPTTRERLAADGSDFLHRILAKCPPCWELVDLWKRPGSVLPNSDKDHVPNICAPDLYTSVASAQHRPITLPSTEKFLLYEPQYGANNQLFALVEASFWARALGRRLVLPPIFLPRVSAYDGNHHTMRNWSFIDNFFTLSHRVQSPRFEAVTGTRKSMVLKEVEAMFEDEGLQTISFTDFHKKNLTAWRLIRAARDAMFDETARIMTSIFRKRAVKSSKDDENDVELVNLRHLFERHLVTVEDVQHLLGGCDDEVLFFDGMFFSNLHGLDTRLLMPYVLSMNDRAENIFKHIKARLHEELGSSHYGCFHFRHGDFLSMCNTIETADTESEIYKVSPGTIRTAQEFLCSVSFEELKLALLSYGSPAFVMSDNPAIVQRELATLPLKTVTSDWVRRQIKEFLPLDTIHRGNDLDMYALLVEEELCAEAKVSVLNRFSTVSQRITSLRRCEGFSYWRKNMASNLRGLAHHSHTFDAFNCLYHRYW